MAPPQYSYTEDFEVPRGKVAKALFYGAVLIKMAITAPNSPDPSPHNLGYPLFLGLYAHNCVNYDNI